MTDHLTSELPKVRSSERSLMFSLSTPQRGLAFPQDNLEDYIWPGHPRQALGFWRYPSHTKCTNRLLDKCKRISNSEQTKSEWTDVMLLLLELPSQYPDVTTPLRGLIIITAHYNQFNGIKVTYSFLPRAPLGDSAPLLLTILDSSKGF